MKYSKTLIALMSLCLSSGCFSVKKNDRFDFLKNPTVKAKISNPDLTLIEKEVPKYYTFPFDRANLYFSTNKTQQTHAVLSRNLCPDAIEHFHQAPIGQTMKQKEWEKYLKIIHMKGNLFLCLFVSPTKFA